MINSSPIETWEGAGVFYSFAGSAGIWFWIAVIMLIVPLFVTLKTENHHETQHKFRSDDSDSTHGVER